jgi:hypothetical protein
MPAASAEKRARQRANKALQNETVPTMLQTSQSTNSEPPEGPASSLPSQPPVPDAITHPASIERLIGLAKDSLPDSALGIVWRHAFEEGVERGMEIGRDLEKRAWGAAGHSNVCITVARPPRGVAIQTEDPPRSTASSAVQVEMPKPLPTAPVLPHTTESTVQTVPSSSALASISTQTESLLPIIVTLSEPSEFPVPILEPPISATVVLAPFNWADDSESDTVSLPTIVPIVIPSKQPRDLSSLRSSSKNPFSSLRRRHCYPKYSQTIPSRRYTTRSYPHSPLRHGDSHTPPFLTTRLDWHRDPRLFELSCVLRTLGWSYP